MSEVDNFMPGFWKLKIFRGVFRGKLKFSPNFQGEHSKLESFKLPISKWPTMGEWCNALANWLHNWQFSGDFWASSFCLALDVRFETVRTTAVRMERGMRAFRSCHIISSNNEINAHSIYPHTHTLILLFLIGLIKFHYKFQICSFFSPLASCISAIP